jgi:hypothetical protein
MFGWIGTDDADFERGLAEFEAEHGIDIRRDVAAALGGEFAFAFDGPIAPVPSWKLVIEVYDPRGLQSTLGQIVETMNDFAQEAGRKGFALTEHDQGRRTFYEIESLDVGLSVHYTFVDGYLFAGSGRGLIQRALQNRGTGITLANAPRFTGSLPADSEVNFSAVVYQNIGAVLGPLARTLGTMAEQYSPDQETILHELAGQTDPSVTLAYGEPDRIVFVNSSQGGLLSSTLGAFLRLDTLMNVQQLLEQAGRQQGGQSSQSSVERSEVEIRVDRHTIEG